MPAPRKMRRKRQTSEPKQTGILSRVQALDDLEEAGLHINLYGDSGTGKTTLWATFPRPILALIASGSERPGECLSVKVPGGSSGIDQLVLASVSDIDEVSKILHAPNKYKTVVLDHITGFQDMVLREVLDVDDVPIQKDWGVATQQQWGQTSGLVKECLSRLLGLKQNVVLVAQKRVYTLGEEADAASEIGPYVASSCTPSVVSYLNSSVNYICQTFIRRKVVLKKYKSGGKVKTKEVETDEFEYCLRVSPHDTYASKFRSPRRDRPKILVDPTYDSIMELIRP